jgi:hypothetical protein
MASAKRWEQRFPEQLKDLSAELPAESQDLSAVCLAASRDLFAELPAAPAGSESDGRIPEAAPDLEVLSGLLVPEWVLA